MTPSLAAAQPHVARAGDEGAASPRGNVVPILLVFKVKVSSDAAEIQGLIERLVLVTAGASMFGVQVRELRAILLDPGKRVFQQDDEIGYEGRQGKGCLLN